MWEAINHFSDNLKCDAANGNTQSDAIPFPITDIQRWTRGLDIKFNECFVGDKSACRKIIRFKTFDKLKAQEIYDILKLRQNAFIVEQSIKYEDIDSKDNESIHLWIEDSRSKEMQAYIRIVPMAAKNEISIGRVVTLAKARGQGIARHLMHYAIEYAFHEFSHLKLMLTTKGHLLDFYKSLGFVETGATFHFPTDDPTPIYEMTYEGEGTLTQPDTHQRRA